MYSLLLRVEYLVAVAAAAVLDLSVIVLFVRCSSVVLCYSLGVIDGVGGVGVVVMLPIA